MENGCHLSQNRFLAAVLALAIKALAPVAPPLRKAFGSLAYAPDLSVIPLDDYCLLTPADAIKAAEAGFRNDVACV